MAGADEADEIDWMGPVPVYQQVAALLRRQIETGHLPPGSRLPSESEIRGRYGVGRDTARAAVRVLRDEGLVFTVPHRASFVAGQPPA